MTTTTTILTLARETDEKLAELYVERQRLHQKVASAEASLLRLAGATYYYRGRRRVTDMEPREAVIIVRDRLGELARWADAHTYWDGDYKGVHWGGYDGPLAPHEQRSAADALSARDRALDDLTENAAASEELEDIWREHQWSRFFLVTSSIGHIHSSMYCSTCRPTTTFGWLPHLSGHGEREAVELHGPALCTVCFPSAPLEWTAERITKARAAQAAHDGTDKTPLAPPKAKPAEEVCEGSGRNVYDGGDYGPKDNYAANRFYRSAHCPACRQSVSVTSTGKLRKHKPAAA